VLGAIAGDVVGSVYEFDAIKTTDFPLLTDRSTFTDDTVLTVATAKALLTDRDFAAAYHSFGRRYPDRGYGGAFQRWLRGPRPGPAYGSWGNGSAMRVSPVGIAAKSAGQALEWAEESAAVTHDHEEGIRGAQAVALAVYLARTGESKLEIRRQVTRMLGYDLERSLDDIRPEYTFDASCQGSVPEAIIAFLESDGVEDSIRRAVSLGGDADTQAAIAGGIAEAHWGSVPHEIGSAVLERLPQEFIEIILVFNERFPMRR
jgi:ADP-ribosylglycohydrolase